MKSETLKIRIETINKAILKLFPPEGFLEFTTIEAGMTKIGEQNLRGYLLQCSKDGYLTLVRRATLPSSDIRKCLTGRLLYEITELGLSYREEPVTPKPISNHRIAKSALTGDLSSRGPMVTEISPGVKRVTHMHFGETNRKHVAPQQPGLSTLESSIFNMVRG